MAKGKAGAKKAKPAKKSPPAKAGLLKSASNKVATAAARLVKAASKIAPKSKAAAKEVEEAPAKAPVGKGSAKGKVAKGKAGNAERAGVVLPEKARPRASKLPPPGQPLTKREMEQILTAGAGRGVMGEGSLKGRLVVKDAFPYLSVIGRDKRELTFLLLGPDQEVLPAYVDHKVSVSGLLKKTTNYGGTVDVRKYSAKKPDTEVPVEPVVAEQKLRYLSPGEVEQICNAGMGAGIRGFATIRGNLEMTGEDFALVVSNGGTRQQVSFLLEGKNAKGLRKHLGHTLQVMGVLDKTSGWGGKISVENSEARQTEFKSISRDNLEVVQIENPTNADSVDVKLNNGLSVRLQERAGHTWAIEPTVAKRIGLREANFEPVSGGAHTREFFFTPRNPGSSEAEFFLAKAFSPAHVIKTIKIMVNVKP